MDKTERLLDVIENPEKYSSVEIEEMLRDSEVGEILDLLCKIKSSLQPIEIPNVGEEWNRFHSKNRDRRKSVVSRLSAFSPGKKAASVFVAILSVSALAAIVGLGYNSIKNKNVEAAQPELTVVNDAAIDERDSMAILSNVDAKPTETIVFDNEPLETVMKRIGVYYGCDVDFKDNSARSLRLFFRWKQSLPIEDVLESLNNFQHINITKEGNILQID